MNNITLRACRVNAGMSRQDVAEYMGKSLQTILFWETGKTRPDKANLEMLAELYGVPVNFILLPNSTQNTN